MVYFVSHCGVTNAVYYASHFSSAFPPLSTFAPRQQPPVTLDIRSGKIPNPGLPSWAGKDVVKEESFTSIIKEESFTFIVKEESFTSVAHIQFGPGADEWATLFFAPAALTRNFFIAVFPSNIYDVRPPFGWTTTATRAQDGWRVTPTSHWYVYFWCPFCGEYHRKYGFASLEPRTGDAEPLNPWSYLVRPTEFPECPSCLGDQRKWNAIARGLHLGAC
jgi:hypothetical protein